MKTIFIYMVLVCSIAQASDLSVLFHKWFGGGGHLSLGPVSAPVAAAAPLNTYSTSISTTTTGADGISTTVTQNTNISWSGSADSIQSLVPEYGLKTVTPAMATPWLSSAYGNSSGSTASGSGTANGTANSVAANDGAAIPVADNTEAGVGDTASAADSAGAQTEASANPAPAAASDSNAQAADATTSEANREPATVGEPVVATEESAKDPDVATVSADGAVATETQAKASTTGASSISYAQSTKDWWNHTKDWADDTYFHTKDVVWDAIPTKTEFQVAQDKTFSGVNKSFYKFDHWMDSVFH